MWWACEHVVPKARINISVRLVILQTAPRLNSRWWIHPKIVICPEATDRAALCQLVNFQQTNQYLYFCVWEFNIVFVLWFYILKPTNNNVSVHISCTVYLSCLLWGTIISALRSFCLTYKEKIRVSSKNFLFSSLFPGTQKAEFTYTVEVKYRI